MFLEYLRHTRESAYWREVDTEGEGLWDVAAHHLANITDLLAWANYQRAGGKKSKGKAPKPVWRPGAKRAAAEKSDRIKRSAELWRKRRAERERKLAEQRETRSQG